MSERLNDMVERVAMAVTEEIGWGTFSHFDPNDVRRIARAAIRGMREPTEAMKMAGERADDEHLASPPGFYVATAVWQAMIDRALVDAAESPAYAAGTDGVKHAVKQSGRSGVSP